MRNKLIAHIAIMVVAVICGGYIAKSLAPWQMEITKEKKDLAFSPIAGFHKFAADIEWMFFINHLGSLNSGAVDKDNLDEVVKRLEKIISYDPNFKKVYQDGVSSIATADPEKTIELFKAACKNDYLKEDWQLPFYVGFVITRYVKDPDYNEAAEYFVKAMKCPSEKPEPQLVSFYFNAKAKAKLKDDKNGEKYGNNENFALLDAMHDEWKKQMAESKAVSGNLAMSSDKIYAMQVKETGYAFPDLVPRMLKVAREVKSSTDPKPSQEVLDYIDNTICKEVLVDQHLCENCLTPVEAGDCFCRNCGNKVQVWGVCPDCGVVLGPGADFCTHCGKRVKVEQPVVAPVAAAVEAKPAVTVPAEEKASQ